MCDINGSITDSKIIWYDVGQSIVAIGGSADVSSVLCKRNSVPHTRIERAWSRMEHTYEEVCLVRRLLLLLD